MVVDGVSANFLFLRRAIEVSLVAENHIDGKLQKQICHLDANGKMCSPVQVLKVFFIEIRENIVAICVLADEIMFISFVFLWHWRGF
jgi:hypothetical protein